MTSGPEWARNPHSAMWCVTLTHGITPEDVLDRYGADARTAQLLTEQQAVELLDRDAPDASVLCAGALGDWSFCSESLGVMGAMPGPLSELSKGTETFSVLRGGDGMNVFAHWRGGRRIEQFEPGNTHTEPAPPHPWWDAIQQRIDSSGGEYTGLVPVLEAIAQYTGKTLDTRVLGGPLLTLRLEESHRTPDPPRTQPSPVLPSTPGRALGRLLGALRPR
ncbi:DUF6461 domain-containing protein [Streptomyces sp. NPDC058637]|uniref:DUF6461 domain-containing protein n=1 Tax=Streptomyces sp. NPDC058637 TaxID=3346569 RepID=UPI0036675BB0